VGLRSFDASRERPVPKVLRGRSLAGAVRGVVVTSFTLVAAIKPNCDGCHEFVDGSLSELDNVKVVLVSATDGDGEWEGVSREILVAPETLIELGIRSAPYYVLVDPTSLLVVAEGAMFSPAQVASEIERFVNL
jgi:hypothetical protein